MSTDERIAAAANTEVPALLALHEEGFKVDMITRNPEAWEAKKENLTLVGGSPLELLGLHALRLRRGAEWKASDAEIEDFLASFYPERSRYSDALSALSKAVVFCLLFWLPPYPLLRQTTSCY